MLPPLEAMACGKPVILSEIPAHREILETSKAGLAFSLSCNNLCIGERIKEVYDNKRSFSSAARKFAEINDWSVVCHKVARIYNEILM